MSILLLPKKLRANAKLPTKNKADDAGFDLYVCLSEDFLDKYGLEINPGETFKIETGVAIAIPKGYFTKIFDRSGVGSKGIETLAGKRIRRWVTSEIPRPTKCVLSCSEYTGCNSYE